jgi:Holliday junction resolvase
MINSRAKGAGAERELAGLIFDQLGVRLIRNLEQARGGGHDLVLHPDEAGPAAEALDRFAIECKRYQRITQASLVNFWQQATEQAAQVGRIPALAYRENRQPWKVMIPLAAMQPALCANPGIDWTGTLSIPGFCHVVRDGPATQAGEAKRAGNR